MKAAVFYRYGTPRVLEIRSVEKPLPGDNEILIRVYATAVNSGDVRLRKADPFAVRFMLGLFRPKLNILGGVFSGRVEATGKNVTRFRIGDDVFGSTDMKFGAYAEYKCIDEKGAVALKPDSLSHEESAVLPFGGATALHFLKKCKIQSGQRILIYGASGAVGTAAVQLAKYFGAEVTGVCSSANTELVKKLGADKVIDYTLENFLEKEEKYDVIFDTVNKLPVKEAFNKLTDSGYLVLGAAGLSEVLALSFIRGKGSKKVLFGMTSQNYEDMKFLADLGEKGILKPVIERSYPIEKIAEAHEHAEKGHKKGNIAITV